MMVMSGSNSRSHSAVPFQVRGALISKALALFHITTVAPALPGEDSQVDSSFSTIRQTSYRGMHRWVQNAHP
jgi:hypothetical protein